MDTFILIVKIAAMLLVPLISFFYVFLRLAARNAQLAYFFTLSGILKAYLISKGHDVSMKENEKEKEYNERLEKAFKKIYNNEFNSEYGMLRYLLAIIVGSVFSAIVVYFLSTSSFGGFLSGKPDSSPSPLQASLLGAFAWNLWLLFSGYEKLDLIPSTFYWMPFRYIIAVIAGFVGTNIFKENGVAIIFALIATTIPYPRLLKFLRRYVPGMKEDHPGAPPLWKIQGMHETTVDRLETLGIQTTQELAYSDPLMLLFRTNFQPKVVIDWIDQSLLYNYVGDNINKLRVRGIRGSIEMSGLRDDDPVLNEIAEVLSVKQSEVRYLRDKLLNDYQQKLVSTLWDEFKPQNPAVNSATRILPLATSAAHASQSAAETVLGNETKSVLPLAGVEVAQSGAGTVKADGGHPAPLKSDPLKSGKGPTDGESSERATNTENT